MPISMVEFPFFLAEISSPPHDGIRGIVCFPKFFRFGITQFISKLWRWGSIVLCISSHSAHWAEKNTIITGLMGFHCEPSVQSHILCFIMDQRVLWAWSVSTTSTLPRQQCHSVVAVFFALRPTASLICLDVYKIKLFCNIFAAQICSAEDMCFEVRWFSQRFVDATIDCQSLGGYLAKTGSVTENAHLSAFLKSLGEQDISSLSSPNQCEGCPEISLLCLTRVS